MPAGFYAILLGKIVSVVYMGWCSKVIWKCARPYQIFWRSVKRLPRYGDLTFLKMATLHVRVKMVNMPNLVAIGQSISDI